jgi:hypothetical protein
LTRPWLWRTRRWRCSPLTAGGALAVD